MTSDRPQLLTILTVVVFFFLVLGLGRWLAQRSLRWVRGRVTWPSGFIAVTSIAILVAGSISEGLAIHAFLGAFLLGAALGGHDKERNEAHEVIGHFVMSFFVPIYFVSMGMSANFITNFDWLLVGIILIVACVSRVGAVVLGARMAGMKVNREVWAISIGLNARGATGITVLLSPYRATAPEIKIETLPLDGAPLFRAGAYAVTTPRGREVIVRNPDRLPGISLAGKPVTKRWIFSR